MCNFNKYFLSVYCVCNNIKSNVEKEKKENKQCFYIEIDHSGCTLETRLEGPGEGAGRSVKGLLSSFRQERKLVWAGW